MSFTSEQKSRIWLYMLEYINCDEPDFVNKTTDAFKISRTTAYNYLRKMVQEGIITKTDLTNSKYMLVTLTSELFTYSTSNRLEEDRIFQNDIKPLISDLPQNVFEILRYVFTEIMNNAIEHSQATEISCHVSRNYLNTKLFIFDNGIGIFRNIQQYFEHQGEKMTLDEAVDALFPGKLTTAKDSHSGEGIFFSSRAADEFMIYSDGRYFSHSPFSEERHSEPNEKSGGTDVYITLANHSVKRLQDVFDRFSDPTRGFFKTQIPIAHMFSGGSPVSRSEARRLCALISNFEEVTLDFQNVPSIGQAFTHELFIVFGNRNPNITLNIINTCELVTRMINRVKNTVPPTDKLDSSQN